MVPLLPEQIQTLREILGDTSDRIAVVLGLSRKVVNDFIVKAVDFVRRRQFAAHGRAYVISLSVATKGKDSLSLRRLADHLRTGKTCFLVDGSLRLLKVTKESVLLTKCTKRSEACRSFDIAVHGEYVYYMVRGKLVGEVNVTHPGAAPQVSSRWHRPMRDIALILKDHMQEDVRDQQGFHYWYDKGKRTLLKGRDGTEMIFHLALFRWLRQFVYDGLDVYAEPSGLGQNKTDINVVTANGKHVIEVKWLGINEKGTSYDEKRIGEGLRQIKIYLDNDQQLVAGHPVIYRC